MKLPDDAQFEQYMKQSRREKTAVAVFLALWVVVCAAVFYFDWGGKITCKQAIEAVKEDK